MSDLIEKLSKELETVHSCMLKVQADMREIVAENTKLREALGMCTSRAGHPDAAEGCRLVIATVRAALGGETLPTSPADISSGGKR